MSFAILSVGQKMPPWCSDGCEEYLKRLQRFIKCELIEIPSTHRSKNIDIETMKKQEGEKILTKIAKDDLVIALHVVGEQWSTPLLAKHLVDWRAKNKSLKFLIGGADGLSDNCLERANIHWSLSQLTFPHALARVILTEQLYRAFSLIALHPYHRE